MQGERCQQQARKNNKYFDYTCNEEYWLWLKIESVIIFQRWIIDQRASSPWKEYEA